MSKRRKENNVEDETNTSIDRRRDVKRMLDQDDIQLCLAADPKKNIDEVSADVRRVVEREMGEALDALGERLGGDLKARESLERLVGGPMRRSMEDGIGKLKRVCERVVFEQPPDPIPSVVTPEEEVECQTINAELVRLQHMLEHRTAELAVIRNAVGVVRGCNQRLGEMLSSCKIVTRDVDLQKLGDLLRDLEGVRRLEGVLKTSTSGGGERGFPSSLEYEFARLRDASSSIGSTISSSSMGGTTTTTTKAMTTTTTTRDLIELSTRIAKSS